MTNHEPHLRKLYDAISAGATGHELGSFFHPDAEQIEFPSLMRPAGHQRPLADMLEASVLGQSMIDDQHYHVLQVIEDGDRVAVQLTWTATTAVELGVLPAGTRLTSHVAAFYDFRDGLVLRQSSYDCYEPLS